MGVISEFEEFLDDYKVLGLVVAFIIGVAATNLVQSLVNNIIMPAIAPLIRGGSWETATLELGPVVLRWGAFLSALINFIIIALVVFVIAKKVMKQEKINKI